MKSHHPCTNCNNTDPAGQWWSLGNYYGLSGTFCPKCYDLVSHDPYGNPRNPKDYNRVLQKQQEQRVYVGH